MADRKRGKDPEEPKQVHKEPDEERPKHRPEGREHEVHKEILERRMRGGPEPTHDAYMRALEQWKNLPGSIVRPPTDVTPPPAAEPPKPPGGDEPERDEKGDKP